MRVTIDIEKLKKDLSRATELSVEMNSIAGTLQGVIEDVHKDSGNSPFTARLLEDSEVISSDMKQVKNLWEELDAQFRKQAGHHNDVLA